jgi:hypothetical protein
MLDVITRFSKAAPRNVRKQARRAQVSEADRNRTDIVSFFSRIRGPFCLCSAPHTLCEAAIVQALLAGKHNIQPAPQIKRFLGPHSCIRILEHLVTPYVERARALHHNKLACEQHPSSCREVQVIQTLIIQYDFEGKKIK